MNDLLIPAIIALFVLAGGYGALKLGDVAHNKQIFGPIIAAIEVKNKIPSGLLFRLIDTESAFLTDVINGARVSSAGAMGIAQIVPKWHPDINPLAPVEALEYAGKYLASLFNQTGDWHKAVAAYNWGIGNLQKAIANYGSDWLAHAPTETKNYVQKIIG